MLVNKKPGKIVAGADCDRCSVCTVLFISHYISYARWDDAELSHG